MAIEYDTEHGVYWVRVDGFVFRTFRLANAFATHAMLDRYSADVIAAANRTGFDYHQTFYEFQLRALLEDMRNFNPNANFNNYIGLYNHLIHLAHDTLHSDRNYRTRQHEDRWINETFSRWLNRGYSPIESQFELDIVDYTIVQSIVQHQQENGDNDDTPALVNLDLGSHRLLEILVPDAEEREDIGTIGSTGDDTITGDSDGDVIITAEGDDTIHAGDGGDIVFSGADEDFVMAGKGNDFVHAGYDDDVVLGEQGDDWLYGMEGHDLIDGGKGNDYLSGGDGDDFLWGDEGNDTLHGDDGDDTLDGDAGEDSLHGGSGKDTLDGGDDRDHLYGDGDDDTLYGQEGDDYLAGGAGNDTLDGGTEDDHLSGGSGNDTLFGKDGNDDLHGGSGNDTLNGAAGNDLLYGDGGNDTLYGDKGRDILVGGAGDDVLQGGDGADTFEFIGWSTGKDVVKDFDIAEGDHLWIEISGVEDLDSFLAFAGSYRQVGDDVEISIGNSEILVENVTWHELVHGDAFEFTY